jgi:hypothetical protein
MSLKEGDVRMGKRILNLSALILVLAAMGMVAAAGDIVYPATDELLGKYETGNMSFEKLEIGDLVVYYHQRTINDAIVEGDFISYQFARNTGELVKKREHWRTDVPDHVTPAITLAQAESMVDGTVQSARLYIISPESEIYHLDPPPVNPCWIVTSVEDGEHHRCHRWNIPGVRDFATPGRGTRGE